MSFPQPNANQYSTGGGGFFRLLTTLTSDGDIYESEQGAHGFAIGPESDISKVNIAYFDPQQPQNQALLTISPTRPFPGFVQAANNEGLYVPTNRPGRILIWPSELFDSTFLPSDIAPNGRIDFEIPVLDVVEYFAPGPATAGRNDKTYDMLRFPWPTGGETWSWVIPFYGRRYATILFSNPDGADTITFTVFGIKYNVVGTQGQNTEIQLIAPTPVGGGAEVEFQILSSTQGMYDALLFVFAHAGGVVLPAGNNPLSITVSDREG